MKRLLPSVIWHSEIACTDCHSDLSATMKSKDRLPWFQLLWRATVFTPLALVISILLIGAGISAIFFPILGIAYFYFGDFKTGLAFILSGGASFFIARYMKKRFWDEPSSLL
jgi:cellulose synthase/poly-beta-1,6-N-acetylglucosamine synthase-like glycosyltransferase